MRRLEVDNGTSTGSFDEKAATRRKRTLLAIGALVLLVMLFKLWLLRRYFVPRGAQRQLGHTGRCAHSAWRNASLAFVRHFEVDSAMISRANILQLSVNGVREGSDCANFLVKKFPRAQVYELDRKSPLKNTMETCISESADIVKEAYRFVNDRPVGAPPSLIGSTRITCYDFAEQLAVADVQGTRLGSGHLIFIGALEGPSLDVVQQRFGRARLEEFRADQAVASPYPTARPIATKAQSDWGNWMDAGNIIELKCSEDNRWTLGAFNCFPSAAQRRFTN